MYELKVRDHFDAAHWLEGYAGKCHKLHGHRWDVEVSFTGHDLDNINMLVDFKTVKRVLNETLDTVLDHDCLNKALAVDNPTAEYIAKWLYQQLETANFVVVGTVRLKSVTIWESPDCSVTYRKRIGGRK